MRKLIFILLLILVIATPVTALKGVGIVYGTVVTTVNENERSCFDYGVYNPWDEDVQVELTVGGDLAQLNTVSENVDLPAGTMHDQAEQVELCFNIPKVYSGSCDVEQKKFIGKIIVTEYFPAGVDGTGSSTSVSAAAPLELRVRCVEKEAAYQFDSQIFIIGAIIVILIAGLYMGMQFFKSHKIVKKK